jgi:eukaryotic-like serine/threonine-protein kinase
MPATNVAYCINRACRERRNAEHRKVCQSCGTSLLINNRYRLLRPLRALGKNYNTEIFEVSDYRGGDRPKVVKILVEGRDRYVQLFKQEQDITISLHHPGIPIGEDAFQVDLDDDTLHCLVMEKIDGIDLEQWKKEGNAFKDESQALRWLEQIAQTLQHVHSNLFFHRDIKPSNIMLRDNGSLVLIDFGTARYISETVVDRRTVTIVYSYGYTAPEQLVGKAVPQSDFYALGRTFVYLFTGQHPDDIDPPRSWHQHSQIPISREFKTLIDHLMASDPAKRIQTAQILLREVRSCQQNYPAKILTKFTKHWRNMILSLLAVVTALFITLVVAAQFKLGSNSIALTATCDTITKDLLSCGEEKFLSSDDLNSATTAAGKKDNYKELAVQAFRSGNYDQAERLFLAAWQQSRLGTPDPEALIYYNNSRIAHRPSSGLVWTIAVAAPLSNTVNSKVFDIGLELLRAVAMSQNEAVQSGLNLRVLVVNDENKSETTSTVAKALVQRENLLGIIGHYASENSIEALSIYEANQLVMISGTSTSTKLSHPRSINTYFFRTVSNTREAAQAMTQKVLYRKAKVNQVAIFFDPKREFSNNMTDEFKDFFQKTGGKVAFTSESLATHSFQAQKVLKKVPEQVGALTLFLGGYTDSISFDNSLALLEANRGQRWIVGSNVMHSKRVLDTLETMLKRGTFPLERLAVMSDWHYSNSPNPAFERAAREQWKGTVSWRTATTYDAVKVLQAAITAAHLQEGNTLDNRKTIRDTIAGSNFKVTHGATGTIRFKGSDRAEANVVILKVLKLCNSEALGFWPMNDSTVKCVPPVIFSTTKP